MNCKCGKKISSREKKLNAGLCDACLQLALRETAKEIAKKNPPRK